MSLPFVFAFGIGQKIPPFGHFQIEYRNNGILSTQKRRNASNLYRKAGRRDSRDSRAPEPKRGDAAFFKISKRMFIKSHRTIVSIARGAAHRHMPSALTLRRRGDS
jgi:hypothetical protein